MKTHLKHTQASFLIKREREKKNSHYTNKTLMIQLLLHLLLYELLQMLHSWD